MRCSRVHRQLAAYVDGLLGPAQKRAVEGHLAGCPPCRSALANMRAARSALRALRAVRAPASFAPRVKAAVRAHAARAWYPPLFGREARGAVAAVCVVLVGGLLISSQMTRPRPYEPSLPTGAAMAVASLGGVSAVAVPLNDAEDTASYAGVYRPGRRAARVLRVAAVSAPVQPVEARPAREPADAVASDASAGRAEAESAPDRPAPEPTVASSTAPRPRMMLAALDVRLLESSAGRIRSTPAALSGPAVDVPDEADPERALSSPNAVGTDGSAGDGGERVVLAGTRGTDTTADVCFASLLSTQSVEWPLSPGDTVQ